MTDELARARLSVACVFLLNGGILASWVPHIPSVKERLAIGEATLGLLLLAMALGALLAFPLASIAVGRFGSRSATAASAALLAATLPLPVLAESPALLAASLFVFGGANGALDVSMNAQGVLVEKRYGRPILSSLHALFSAGGLVGAGTAALFLRDGASPATHLAAAAAAGLVLVAVCSAFLLEPERPESRDAPVFVRPDPALLGLGALAFLGLMAEGAMADWSALYLRQSLGSDAALASMAFAAFSLAMAAGRFAGDRLAERYGAEVLLRRSALLASGGLAIALVLAHPLVAIAGCTAVGFGIANVVPLLFRAAAATSPQHPERALAAVTTTGYLGFLVGPPAIGFLAGATSLPFGLAIVALACAVIATAGKRVLKSRSDVLPVSIFE